MGNRSVEGVGQETVDVVAAGHYVTATGLEVQIADAVARARFGTELFTPDAIQSLVRRPSRPLSNPGLIEVTPETTLTVAMRLASTGARVAVLNFASAKNPGGGFLGKARAQEESLARASALHSCLLEAPAFYNENRACGSALYTDHLIYSPDVPFIRDDEHQFLETPFLVSVITSPAPNTGAATEPTPKVQKTFERRAAHVLAVAEDKGHRAIVLGAWGCGVFGGDPAVVADVFGQHLESARFHRSFDYVAFAIFDQTGDGPNFRAFMDRFG